MHYLGEEERWIESLPQAIRILSAESRAIQQSPRRIGCIEYVGERRVWSDGALRNEALAIELWLPKLFDSTKVLFELIRPAKTSDGRMEAYNTSASAHRRIGQLVIDRHL